MTITSSAPEEDDVAGLGLLLVDSRGSADVSTSSSLRRLVPARATGVGGGESSRSMTSTDALCCTRELRIVTGTVAPDTVEVDVAP